MATNFDKDKPAGTDKLRDSDDMIRANWAALEDAIARNHEFPGDEGSNAGEHTVVELQDQAGDPTTPADIVAIYNNGDSLFARLQNSGDIFKINQARFTQVKSAAYTAVLGDLGNVLLVSGATTISLDPAATLGNGWFIYIKKTDVSDVVTIDPNASETVDGETTVGLDTQFDVVAIVCDGSNFHVIALQSAKPFITFENSEHDHSDSANGGLIDGATLIPYIRLHDVKGPTTGGGVFTGGAWRKRTCTEDQDTGNNASVSSSVIALQAGTYDFRANCCVNVVAQNQARLRNTSDGITEVLGTNVAASSGDAESSTATISGRFTIAATKNFEIQHRALGSGTFGLAPSSSFGENTVWLVAEFWKVA